MEWLAEHWTEVAKSLGELTAALAALTTAVIGLCSILVKIIPVLAKDNPSLPLVKVLGKIALNRCITEEERPQTETEKGTTNV